LPPPSREAGMNFQRVKVLQSFDGRNIDGSDVIAERGNKRIDTEASLR
jgi:hypothetical protein